MATTAFRNSNSRPSSKDLVGRFARVRNNDLGIGKVIAINGPRVTVEYFESITNRMTESVSIADLNLVGLQPETRCYLQIDEEGTWAVGRIGVRDQQDNTYEVTLPGTRAGYVPESTLYVRCAKTIDDPTDTLIAS